YYDPPRRPAAGERPDFTSLPLTDKPVTVSNMRAAGGGFSLDREGFTLTTALLNSPVVRVSGRVGPRPAGTTFTGDFAHADFSAAAAAAMLRRNLPPA